MILKIINLKIQNKTVEKVKNKSILRLLLIKLKYIYIKTRLIIECGNGHLINFMKIQEKLIIDAVIVIIQEVL